MNRIELIQDAMTAQEIASDLETVRLVNGFSQAKLAEIVGLKRYTIDNWESKIGLSDSVNLFRAFHACGARVKIVPTLELKALLGTRS